MKRSVWIFLSVIMIFLTGFLFFFVGQSPLDQQSSKKFNVILVVADALRYDALGHNGGAASTPHIDRLARDGVTFTRAYSTAPCTMPSSVSMFTGNYSMAYSVIPARTGRGTTSWNYFFYVPSTEPLLGKSLKQLGYQVNMSIENPNASGSNNLQEFALLSKRSDLTGTDVALVEKTTGIENLNWDENGRISSRYDDSYGMLAFLLQQKAVDNFFLVKWYADPHSPYNPPEKFKTGFSVTAENLPQEETVYTSLTGSDLHGLSKDELSYIQQLYRAEVESIDERMGYILKALESNNLLESTYIVFTSDHGEMFGEHNAMSHGGAFWEELLHVPLIFHGPRLASGTSANAATSLIDLMPTLKELLGVRYKDDTQGESFLPALLGQPIQDRILFFDQMAMQLEPGKIREDAALIKDGYKLIMNFRNNRAVFSLFDLEADPFENVNLYEQKREIAEPLYQEILKRKKLNADKREIAKRATSQEIEYKEMDDETINKLKALGYIK